MLVMVNSMTMMMVTVTQIPTAVLIINTLSWAKSSDKQADLHVRFFFSFVSIGAATMMMVSKMVRVVEKLGVGKDNVHVNCQWVANTGCVFHVYQRWRRHCSIKQSN